MAKSKKTEAKKERELLDAQPVYSIEDDLIIYKNGRVSAGFEIQCLEMESPSPGLIQDLNNRFMDMLKELPVNCVVQKLDVYYELPYKVDLKNLPYYQKKIHSKFMDYPVLKHRSLIFFNYPTNDDKQIKRNPLNTFFASMNRFLPENPFEDIEARMHEADRDSERAIKSFAGGLLGYRRLKEQALNNVLYQYFNLDFSKKYDRLERSISNGDTYVGVGEIKANIITMIGQGMEVEPVVPSIGNVAGPFIFPLTHYLGFPHIYIQSYRVEDQKKMLAKFDTDLKLNVGLSGNPWLKTQDHDLKAEELTEFTGEIRASSRNTISFNASVIVHSINDYERKDMIHRTKEAFKMLGSAEYRIEGNDTSNLYFALSPGNAWDNFRWIETFSDYSVLYANFITNYRSDKTGLIVGDRFRNPIKLNMFNTNLDNQNSITIGGSGSGKSYKENYFAIQRYELDAIQVILDSGGTYKNLITALDGLYIEYSAEKPVSFNPFLLFKSKDGTYNIKTDVNQGKIITIYTILELVWKGKEKLTQAERSILSQLVPEYYDYLNDNLNEHPSLNSFVKFIDHWLENATLDQGTQDQLQYFDFKNLFTVLRPFTAGVYKDLLNNPSTLQMADHKAICFDLKKLKQDTQIYPIVSTLIIQLVFDLLELYPEKIKYLNLDEAWSMLQGNMEEFIEHMFRTIRKLNGSINIITQSINEIIKCSAGPAILANCAIIQILSHQGKNEEVEKLANILGFTEFEVDQVNSIRKESDSREIAIKMGDTMKVYTIEASDHIAVLSSSTPKIRNYLVDLYKKLGDMDHAVRQVVEDQSLKKGQFKDVEFDIDEE